MIQRRVRVPLLASLALSAGCATLSEQQCLTVDWWQLGGTDAMAGHAPYQVERHRQACAGIGVEPDVQQWQEGYAQALPRFCVGTHGYRIGSQNGGYHGQCPADLEAGFVAGLQLGQELYELDLRIREQDIEVDRLRKAMRADDATETSRRIDGRWLEHHKRERERLYEQRWRVQERARSAGF